MPKGYLLYADGTYSDYMDWTKAPEILPSGAQWVEGEPTGSQRQPDTLASELSAFFAALPKKARGAFLPVLGGFKAALEINDLEAIQESAKALVVPPELEEAKAALLQILGA